MRRRPILSCPIGWHELAHEGLLDAAWLPELVKSAYFDDGRMVMRHQDKLRARQSTTPNTAISASTTASQPSTARRHSAGARRSSM